MTWLVGRLYEFTAIVMTVPFRSCVRTVPNSGDQSWTTLLLSMRFSYPTLTIITLPVSKFFKYIARAHYRKYVVNSQRLTSLVHDLNWRAWQMTPDTTKPQANEHCPPVCFQDYGGRSQGNLTTVTKLPELVNWKLILGLKAMLTRVLKGGFTNTSKIISAGTGWQRSSLREDESYG